MHRTPIADVTALRLRRYESDDADAIWDLHVRALDDVGAYDEEFVHLDADLRAIEEDYLESGGEFLVGEVDDELVAMGAFQPHDDREATVVIRRMRVDPAYQRRGFATQLLDELERRARYRGFERAILDTTPRQRAAIALYESRGYREVRRETVRGHELVFYERSLTTESE